MHRAYKDMVNLATRREGAQGEKVMKGSMTLIFVVGFFIAAAMAGDRRFIVATKSSDITINEYPLWTDASWYRRCMRAVTDGASGEDRQRFCTDGFNDMKPKVGVVMRGDEVEFLDSRACSPLVEVRVLTGKLKDRTGCLSATALSGFKP